MEIRRIELGGESVLRGGVDSLVRRRRLFLPFRGAREGLEVRGCRCRRVMCEG